MEKMTELRLKTLRKIPGHVKNTAIAKVVSDYFSAIEKYNTQRDVIKYENQKGELIAFLIPSCFYHRFYGQVLTQYIFDYDYEYEDQAIDFLANKIDQLKKNQGVQLIEAYAPAQKMVDQLSDWKIAASSFGGEPKRSKTAIQGKLQNQLTEAGLLIQEAEHEADVEEIMSIKQQCFQSHPELCWFWEGERYQSHEYLRLINSLGKGQTFVVKNKDEIVGYVGLHFDFESVYWGPCSGIDLLLKSKYQGKKLSYELYNFAFQKMLANGIKLYKGATANPGVINVGEQMDRWIIYWQLVPK